MRLSAYFPLYHVEKHVGLEVRPVAPASQPASQPARAGQGYVRNEVRRDILTLTVAFHDPSVRLGTS